MSALGDLGEVLAAAVLFAVPVAIGSVFFRKNARERAKNFAAFADDMAARGFGVRPGSTAASWSARGEVGGVPVAIEPFTVRTGSGKGARTDLFTAVRIEAPASLPKAAAYLTASVPLTELGAMRELGLPPDLAAKYRAFGERPEECATWFGAEARELLSAVGSARSIATTSGALVLVLEGHPTSAPLLLRAAELLAAMHARRAAAPAAPLPKDDGWESDWLVPATLPFLVAIPLGIPIACTAPVLDLATPIVCEDGHVENRGTNKNPLKCVDEHGIPHENAHLVPILLGASVVYYPTMIGCALWAASRPARRRGRRDEPPHRAPYR